MPLRSPKMYCFIFGFPRRVWWPKWTPASSRSLMPTLAATPVASGAGEGVGTVVSDKYGLLQTAPGGARAPRAFRPLAGLEVKRLALAELEPAAGALLSVLLALLDPRVAGQEAGLLELAPQLGVELAQGPRDAVADRPGLRADAAAVDRGHDVEAVVRLGDRERLLDDLLQGFDAAEVLVEAAVVQLELARAGAEVDAGDRGLALAGSAVLEGGCRAQGFSGSCYRLRGCGFCAWCGCLGPG